MIDIDLFAGAGGLAIGIHDAGFGPLNLYEKDEIACSTLRHNTSDAKRTIIGTVVSMDVKDVAWNPLQGKVRLLAAGAPCHPFSLGGKHKASNDGRNLFPEVVRAVRELNPQAVMVE